MIGVAEAEAEARTGLGVRQEAEANMTAWRKHCCMGAGNLYHDMRMRCQTCSITPPDEQFEVDQPVLSRIHTHAGEGTVINMTSRSGHADPPGPVGQGGWGYAYAASKSALHRMVPILHQEHGNSGLRAFNVDPGYTPTDTMRALRGPRTDLDDAWAGAPPEVTAAVIRWLATAEEAAEYVGATVQSHRLCAQRQLWPGWDGKQYRPPPDPSS